MAAPIPVGSAPTAAMLANAGVPASAREVVCIFSPYRAPIMYHEEHGDKFCFNFGF